MESYPSRDAEVGGIPVRRALPKRQRRTVGAWCFLDHFGPVDAADGLDAAMRVGPHPHIGLQTVTWLLDGEVLHTDSLGSEQEIRPGQLNLMTAGRGIAHAEVSTGRANRLHGAQLWVAQPDGTRDGDARFEHLAALPVVDDGGFEFTVLVGDLLGGRSAAVTDTALVGADFRAAGPATTELELDPAFEYCVVVLDGRLTIDGTLVEPGTLNVVDAATTSIELATDTPTRALLLGGEPLGEEVLMWWNFVARTRDEVDTARRDWAAADGRFGDVVSALERIPAPAS